MFKSMQQFYSIHPKYEYKYNHVSFSCANSPDSQKLPLPGIDLDHDSDR